MNRAATPAILAAVMLLALAVMPIFDWGKSMEQKLWMQWPNLSSDNLKSKIQTLAKDI